MQRQRRPACRKTEMCQTTEETRRKESKPIMEKAIFAAGCFWGVEDAFRNVKGVQDVTVGYTGGHTQNPTYKQVCSDTTGHAEAVEVVYDPAVVSYDDLLKLFWQIHNPTTRNRQGPDIGTQYRSVIFTHTRWQEAAARAAVARLEQSGRYRQPIVTEIVPATIFYRAEEYHQRYYEKYGLTRYGPGFNLNPLAALRSLASSSLRVLGLGASRSGK
jgi:peptide-methionine (S)-S-oxide reductase